MKQKSILLSVLIIAICLFGIKLLVHKSASNNNKFIYQPRELTQAEKYLLNDRKPLYPDSLNNLIEYKINTAGTSEDLELLNSISDKWYRDSVQEGNPKVVSAYSFDFVWGEISMILQVEPLEYTITNKGYEKLFNEGGIKKLGKTFGNVIASKSITLSGFKGGEFIIKSPPIGNSENSAYALKYLTLFKDNIITLSYGVACDTDAHAKKVFSDNLELFQTLSNRFKIIIIK